MLRKEISEVLGGIDVRHLDDLALDELANEEMPSIDVFGALVMFGVIRQVTCARVVHKKLDDFVADQFELLEKVRKVDSLLGCLRCSDYFGLT